MVEAAWRDGSVAVASGDRAGLATSTGGPLGGLSDEMEGKDVSPFTVGDIGT